MYCRLCSLVWISDASVHVLAILNSGVEVVRPMSMDASQGAMKTYLFIYEKRVQRGFCLDESTWAPFPTQILLLLIFMKPKLKKMHKKNYSSIKKCPLEHVALLKIPLPI
jgi:hypothetical protein